MKQRISRVVHRLLYRTVVAHHHVKNAIIPREANYYRPYALRHRALTGYAIAIIVIKVAISGLLFAYPGPSLTSNLTPSAIVQLTNDARASNKVKSLKTNSKLTNAASLKAKDMLSKGYFAHVSPQKVTPWYWVNKAGYKYTSAGENLAMDFVTAEDVTQAWLKSPSHRKNLLNSRYVDIGVAVSSGKIDNMNTTIVVQFFGSPSPVQQEVKKVAKVTPPKPTTQVKKSTVAVASPVPSTPNPVLGEETVQPVPPAQPKITSPDNGIILATSQPWIGGEAQPDTVVELFSNGVKVGVTTSDELGYFRLQPAQPLAEGTLALTATAVRSDLTSIASPSLSVTVDTAPPSAALQSAVILPARDPSRGYLIAGTLSGDEISKACIRIGNSCQDLTVTHGTFALQVQPRFGDGAEAVSLELRDPVGNVSTVPVAMISFLDLDIVQPAKSGPFAFVPKLVFYSQRFFITFWLFLFLALVVNILVRIRVQHRATILYTLLLLYGISIILLV